MESAAAVNSPAAEFPAGHAEGGEVRSARASQRLSQVSSRAGAAASPAAVVAALSAVDTAPAAGAAASAAASSAAGKHAFFSSGAGGDGGARSRRSKLSPASRRGESVPRLRPKKTHSGLEEKMEATGHAYGVYVHWDEYAGHHVHVFPPEVDAMHADEVLLVPSGDDMPSEERTALSGRAHLSCGLTLAPAAAPAADASMALRGQQQATRQQQQRHRRHCIPLYKYQPKLCEKSRRIVDEYRETRLLEVWQNIDLHAENVVDFFSMQWLPPAFLGFHSHISPAADQTHVHFSAESMPHVSATAGDPPGAPAALASVGASGAGPRGGAKSAALAAAADAPPAQHPAAGLLPGESGEGGVDAGEGSLLSPVEERFVQVALLPRFFMTAMLPVNQKVAQALVAEASAAARASGATAEEELLPKAKTVAVERDLVLLLENEETPTSRLRSAAGLSGAAAAGAAPTATGGPAVAAAAAKRKAGTAAGHGGPVGDGRGGGDSRAGPTPEAAAGATLPCLLVPKSAFVKAGLLALQRCFGEPTAAGAAAVDAYRDALMRGCGRRMQQLRQQRLQQRQQLLPSAQQPLRFPWDLQHQELQMQQPRPHMGTSISHRGTDDYFDETCPLYYKPYIFHYARHLEQKRREAKQQLQQDTAPSAGGASCPTARIESPGIVAGRAAGRAAARRYPPRCLQPLPLSDAADWPGAVAEEVTAAVAGGLSTAAAEAAACGRKEFPAAGLQRVVTRFDEQIAHYLRKKRQLQHMKRALEEMQQREFCSFHPAVNKTPRYLKELRQQRQAAAAAKTEQQQGRRRAWLQNSGLAMFDEAGEAAAAGPMEILALYCKYYTEDPRYEQLVQEIRECCFQPNVSKFVLREKKRQQQMEQQDSRRLQQLEQGGKQQQQRRGHQRKDGEQQQEEQQGRQRDRRLQGADSPDEDRVISSGDASAPAGAAPPAKGTAGSAAAEAAARKTAAEAQAAAADELFAKLDTPFDSIFDADIRQWLQSSDGRHYCKKQQGRRKTRRSSVSSSDSFCPAPERKGEVTTSESSDEEESVQQQQHEWKNWIREGRQPQYRGPRQRSSSKVLLAALLDGHAAAAAENPLAADAGAALKAKSDATAAVRKGTRLPVSSPYNRWVEGLRGGYLSNPMDFSPGGEEARGEDEKKTRRYCMRNWSRYIRLEQRAVEARVLPNRDIADALCEAYMPSAELPGPTLWTPRRSRWKPPEECNPSAQTYTQANYCSAFTNGHGLLKRGARSSTVRAGVSFADRQTDSCSADVRHGDTLCGPLPSASRAARYEQRRQQELQQLQQLQPQQQLTGLLRMSRNGEKPGTLQDAEPATFVLSTPAKTHKIREQFRVYVQLRHGIDSGEICVPPRVCAVKRKDVLQALEKELEEEVPQLLLLSRASEDLAAADAEEREKEATQQQVTTEPAGPNQPGETDARQKNEEEKEADEKEQTIDPSWSRASTAAAECGTEDEVRNAAPTAAEARGTAEDGGTPAPADEHTLSRPSQRILVVY